MNTKLKMMNLNRNKETYQNAKESDLRLFRFLLF